MVHAHAETFNSPMGDFLLWDFSGPRGTHGHCRILAALDCLWRPTLPQNNVPICFCLVGNVCLPQTHLHFAECVLTPVVLPKSTHCSCSPNTSAPFSRCRFPVHCSSPNPSVTFSGKPSFTLQHRYRESLTLSWSFTTS